MSLEVRVSGGRKIHEVAAQMRAEGRKDLLRQMSEALTKAAEPLKEDIRTSAVETMPVSGGYNATFDKSLRFRVARKSAAAEAQVSLTTYADGSSERRDIRSLNAGRLRHPVFGRSREGKRKGERHANPWAVTSIRAGFWDRGVKGAADKAEKQMLDVVDKYAEELIK